MALAVGIPQLPGVFAGCPAWIGQIFGCLLYTSLTPGAKELLMRYEAYKTSCTQMAESLYNTHFSTFRPEKPASYRR